MASTMNDTISAEERDQLLKNLVIPPRPSVLDSLMALRNDPDINLQKVGKVISADIALSAAILKAANSPVVRRGKRISSVSQAMNLLGLKNVISLISGLVLRSRLTDSAPPSIEIFWERAMQIAMINNALCEHLGNTPEDSSSYALFHGCGIALMLMRFSNFERTLQLIDMATDSRIPRVEQELHGSSHDVVGYLVGRAWNMPEPFCRAILLQYDPHVFDPEIELPIGQDERMMIALTRAATNVWLTQIPGNADAGWPELGESVLKMIGIDPVDFEDWRDHMHQCLAL
jgi:HD-like signal output (HDOD) protein